MKKLFIIIASILFMFNFSGCSASDNCDCASKYLYRKTFTIERWDEEKNLYDLLPEKAEVIQVVDVEKTGYFPKYDVIYTIHNCK